MKKEQEKLKKNPVTSDMVPGHETAQAWGFVLAAYFLLEESFKALIYIRGNTQIPRTHSLSTLFEIMNETDRKVLQQYHSDFRSSNSDHLGSFPFEDLRKFLTNLDGDNSNTNAHIGSFDWRYFLIEEKRSNEMPIISIEYMHEITFGCIRVIEYALYGRFNPSQYTLSQRMRRRREQTYLDWLSVRMNTSEWKDRDDTLEILWGPDPLGHFDMLLPKRGQLKFGQIPEDHGLPVVDLRYEIKNFSTNSEIM